MTTTIRLWPVYKEYKGSYSLFAYFASKEAAENFTFAEPTGCYLVGEYESFTQGYEETE